MIYKEKEFPFKLDESQPKKPSKIKPTITQMKVAIESAMKDFCEIDLPRLDKEYPPISGDTLKQVINE